MIPADLGVVVEEIAVLRRMSEKRQLIQRDGWRLTGAGQPEAIDSDLVRRMRTMGWIRKVPTVRAGVSIMRLTESGRRRLARHEGAPEACDRPC